MNAQINLAEARSRMKTMGLQGLLICSPENFIYSTGFTPMLLDLYRLVPLALHFLPADESIAPVLFLPGSDVESARQATGIDKIFAFPVWWELYHYSRTDGDFESLKKTLLQKPNPLPQQYVIADICQLVADYLGKAGFGKASIGIEMDFISTSVFSTLSQCSPDITYINSSDMLYEMRSIKNSVEIEYLKKACRLTEAGIVSSSRAIKAGASIGDLLYAFKSAVLECARENDWLALLGEMGGQPALGAANAHSSDTIFTGVSTTVKYDMQVSVAHYHSDVGRTYLYGHPTHEQAFLYDGLLETHKRLIEAVQPGRRISDVYQAGRVGLESKGLNILARGHFGHSVGLDNKIEEPPFISATDTTVLQPGMVLAVETPCYFEGIGKYQIEDMVCVTQDGCEIFNRLDKDWLIQS